MSNFNKSTNKDIAIRIFEIRKRKGEYHKLRPFEAFAKINRTLTEYLDSKGEFYFDKMSTYYLDKDSEELIILNPKVRITELYLSHFGLSPLEDEYKRSLKALELHALEYGTEVKIHQGFQFSREVSSRYQGSYGKEFH